MTLSPESAEKVVAEWRAAMEEVPDGEIDRAFIVDGHGEAIQGEAVLYLPDDNEAEFRGSHAEVISAWIARCSPSGISGLLALIEQQAAELAEVRRSVSDYATQCGKQRGRAEAAEARVTALEAERATDHAILRDLVASLNRRGQTLSISHDELSALEARATQALSRSSTEVKNDG